MSKRKRDKQIDGPVSRGDDPPPQDQAATAEAPLMGTLAADAAPAEAGPPFLATEYIFATESGVRKVIYTPVGGPIPPTPEGTRLIGTINFPFATAEARAAAIR